MFWLCDPCKGIYRPNPNKGLTFGMVKIENKLVNIEKKKLGRYLGYKMI